MVIQANCSERLQVASNNSGNASCKESLFHPTGNESEPIITSMSEDNFEHGIVSNETRDSYKNSDNKVAIPLPLHKAAGRNSHAVPAKARPLTNKERLLLRKQALKMRKRPVLAVGEIYYTNCFSTFLPQHVVIIFVRNPVLTKFETMIMS